jgi:hypothetical protein
MGNKLIATKSSVEIDIEFGSKLLLIGWKEGNELSINYFIHRFWWFGVWDIQPGVCCVGTLRFRLWDGRRGPRFLREKNLILELIEIWGVYPWRLMTLLCHYHVWAGLNPKWSQVAIFVVSDILFFQKYCLQYYPLHHNHPILSETQAENKEMYKKWGFQALKLEAITE